MRSRSRGGRRSRRFRWQGGESSGDGIGVAVVAEVRWEVGGDWSVREDDYGWGGRCGSFTWPREAYTGWRRPDCYMDCASVCPAGRPSGLSLACYIRLCRPRPTRTHARPCSGRAKTCWASCHPFSTTHLSIYKFNQRDVHVSGRCEGRARRVHEGFDR